MTILETSDVILLPTYEQVIDYRKRAAGDGSAASFGVAVTTFDAWLADLWELYGDGRKIAGAPERMFAMARACEDVAPAVLLRSDGVVSLAARCLHAGAGVPTFEAALDAAYEAAGAGAPWATRDASFAGCGAPIAFDAACSETRAACSSSVVLADLSEPECALVYVMAYGKRLLEKAGLVEIGEVLARLPEAMAHAPHQTVCTEALAPLTVQQRTFFDTCASLSLIEHPALGSDGIRPVPEGVSLRFAFPSGRYAEPHLLVDVIRDNLSQGSVVLGCTHPLEKYEAIAPALTAANIPCALRGRISFSQTDTGRMFAAMRTLITTKAPTAQHLTDVLYQPLLGLPLAQVRKIDARLRADRLLDVAAEFACLRAENELLSYWEDVVSDPDAVVLIGAIEDYVRSRYDTSEAWRRAQLGALKVLKNTLNIACRMGQNIAACEVVLEQTTVDISRECAVQDPCDASVLICDMSSAQALGKHVCATLVLCDMDSAHIPVADTENAARVLLEKLGVASTDDALSFARRQFFALEQVPMHAFIIERCLFDADAEPTYPTMAAEELVDCYRADPRATDDIDNPYLLPAHLQEGMYERGEEHLYENAALTYTTQPCAARIPQPVVDVVSPARRHLVLMPRLNAAGDVQPPRLSASQIENYMACPYLWFANRRLRLESLDEDFGPLQMGDFAHHALEAFYRTFQEQTGMAKVTFDTLDQAREIMRAVASECAQRQFELKPTDNRLVFRTHFEQREVEELQGRLLDYLDFEAELLPTFRPTYFEYEVGSAAEVYYAGAQLVGKIDRIDVDDQGRAVIIDYKGSISSNYALATCGRTLPAKIQTLIYAQVIRRMLGLEVVGALYVSYGRVRAVSGAYDACALETPHLPAMQHVHCQYTPEPGASFATLLDETEERAACAVRALLAGEVPQSPNEPGACSWCPVSACTKREA